MKRALIIAGCIGFLVALVMPMLWSHPNWFLCKGHYLHAYGNWSDASYHANPNGKGWNIGVQFRTCERCGIQQARRLPY